MSGVLDPGKEPEPELKELGRQLDFVVIGESAATLPARPSAPSCPRRRPIRLRLIEDLSADAPLEVTTRQSAFPDWALKVRRMPQIRWVNKQRKWICSCRQDSG